MKKRNKNKILLFLLGILTTFVIALLLFLQSPFFEVELRITESRLEIGEEVSNDPFYYLDGADWCVSLSQVDASSVKKTRVGRYPVYIYHGFRKYTSYVNVTDNTPPTITCDIQNKTVTPGDVLSAHSLGIHATDYSGVETIQFTKISSTNFYLPLPDEQTVEIRDLYRKGIPIEGDKFQFAYGGIYTMTISVSDTYNNISDFSLTVTVEEPPVLEVPNNFYVADTPQIDFSKYITAWDFVDGEFDFSDIEIDTSQLKPTTPGTYPVIFSITDHYGLTTAKRANVHVSSQNDLQELLNQHSVDLSKDVIIGIKNPYDIGYFSDSDIHSIQNAMLPCLVHIQNSALGSFGSGFIIEINDKFVTIATNQHVIKNDPIVDISFFDGKCYNGSVVAASPERDIAFVRIPIEENDTISAISSDSVQKLRTVHINKRYWDNLADDCKLAITYASINSNGKIWHTDIGYIVEKEAIRNWNQYKNVNETLISFKPIAGTSGSALFDEHGQLVGMIRGYTEYRGYTENVAVPLKDILNYFEVVFKYKIHYQ